MPTGLIAKENIGFGGMSKSFGRPPEPFFSVRLKPLGAIGIDRDVIIYGDEATLDFMSELKIPWGNAEPAVWDSLQAGWQWSWNVRTKLLTIRDASGNITLRQSASWSELAVAADVLESHQFLYRFDGASLPDVFLIATKENGSRKADGEDILWGEFDRYLSAAYHALFGRLCHWLDGPGYGKADDAPYTAIEDLRKAISAKVGELSANGLWPQNLLLAAAGGIGVPKKVPREAMVTALGKYLMLSMLTASMLQADKPCYEPWMLWQMFKWLQKSTYIELEDKIFDLSPNWG